MRYSVAMFAIAILLVACDVNRSAAQESSRTRLIYLTLCASCHGPIGKGDGPEAATLRRRPRAFDDCTVMNNLPDEVLFRAIKYGGAAVGLSDEMPGWAVGIADRDIVELVRYVRGFCRKALARNRSDLCFTTIPVAPERGLRPAGPGAAKPRVSALSAHFSRFED